MANFDGHIYYDNAVIDVGALAAGDVTTVTLKQDGSRSQGFRFMKTEYWIVLENATDFESVMCGLAGPAIDAAEIEEAIEADPDSPHDRSASEQAMRPIWPLEVLMDTAQGDGRVVAKGTINLRWSFPEATAMNFWCYNMDVANPITTGARLRIFCKHYGVWLRD